MYNYCRITSSNVSTSKSTTEVFYTEQTISETGIDMETESIMISEYNKDNSKNKKLLLLIILLLLAALTMTAIIIKRKD